MKSKSLALSHGGSVAFDIIDPFAYLWAVASRRRFADILERAVLKHPPRADSPWNILQYADEVTPGNVKKSDNQKRIHGMYWTFVELGNDALAKEDVWATISALRSTTLGRVDGGMSAVMAVVLKAFFSDDGHNMQHGGCAVMLHGRPVRIWAKFGGFISDESALHSIWLCKGASGTKICILCMNMVSKHWMGIPGLDNAAWMKPFNRALMCHMCEPHTKETIQHIVDTLAADHRVMPADAFKNKQTALGFTHSPHALLLDPSLRDVLDPTQQTLFDWPHSLLQGVFPVHISLLEARMSQRHIAFYALLDEYLQGWTLPKQSSGTSWRSALNPRRRDTMSKEHDFKASMSETLALYPIISHWLRTVVHSLGYMVVECNAFFDVTTLIDLLLMAGRGKVRPNDIKVAAEKFLNSHAAAYGVDEMIPKFHHLLHLHSTVESFNTLPTTLPLERKHKVIKQFAEATDNTSKTWDRSVLLEATFKSLGVLDSAEHLILDPGLLSPSEKVPAPILNYLREHLGEHHYMHASRARYSCEGTCSGGDVVAYRADGGWSPGVVHFFFKVAGQERALLKSLRHVSHERTYSNWEETLSCICVSLGDIITPLTFRKEDNAYTLLHPWSLQR